MPTHPLPHSLVHLAALSGCAIVTGAAALSAGSTATLVVAVTAATGAAAAAISALQIGLRQREARERLDFEETRLRQSDNTLFATRPDALRAARTREHFERFLLPFLALLLGAAQALAAAWLWRRLASATPTAAAQIPFILSACGLQALAGFVLGRYAAGLAQSDPLRLLRPAASHLLLASALATLAALSSAAAYFGFPGADPGLARVLIVLLAALALELAANLLLELYRPRTRTGTPHPVHESRLLGLFSQPGGLMRTAAQTLDYQFGFKVSETWFYRYLQQALGGLLLLQATLVWLSSALVIIEPHEHALLERFGRPVAARPILPPGLHLKWPWPIDRAHIVGTQEVRTFNVGFVPDPTLDRDNTLLWTRTHYKEELNLLVASREADHSLASDAPLAVPVNLLTVSIPIHYRITNLVDWTRRHHDPGRLLPLLATREVTRYLVSVDPEEIMASGRRQAAADLRRLIQQQADAAQTGVEILFVGLQDIHPPVQIADAYEAVVSATQERETRILDAEAYRADLLPRAQAEADRRLREQLGAATGRVARASAQAARFQRQIGAASAAPGVFRQWMYHELLTATLAHPRKFILTTTNTQHQFWLNFEDKLRTDLLDVAVPPAGPR